MFYNARWYDPSLGRFAQADSIVLGGVQGLDRYAYVNNSPMNYVDPSGHTPACDDGDWDGCYSSGTGNRGTTGSSGNNSGNDNSNPTLGGGLGLNEHADVISDLLTGMPTNENMCRFVFSGSGAGNMCSAGYYSGMFDPYNPYSAPALLQNVPIIFWEPDSVNWGDVSIDVIGIGADLYPPGQPYAISLEIAGAGLNGVNLSLSTIEVDNYLHGRQPSVDSIGFALDIFSIPPEIGIYASVAGLGYDLTKGFNIYYLQTFYGPPQPQK